MSIQSQIRTHTSSCCDYHKEAFFHESLLNKLIASSQLKLALISRSVCLLIKKYFIIISSDLCLLLFLSPYCCRCVEQFNTRFGLQKHLLTCDQSQLEDVSPVFACLECNSVFSTQIGLEYHNKDHTETDFACRDCQQGYQILVSINT